MLKNNNQAVVKRISRRSMQSNRIRNLFAVLAIILTSFMFTTVFSIGFSLAKNMNTLTLREARTRAKIFLMHPSEEQIKQAKDCSALDAAGVMISVASASPASGEDLGFLLQYHDDEDFSKNIKPALTDVEGKYPTAENELMLPVSALEALHIDNPKIGMELVLRIKDTERSFVLSGTFRDYGFRTNSFEAYVSKACADSFGLTAEKDGVLSLSAKSFSTKKLMQQLNEKVTLSENQNFESNLSHQGNESFAITVVILLICFLIVASGYLLIYNIMYISVSRDIRFYGMLKTIGTTPSQIQKIVKMQAFRLSAFSIPIGIALGALTSFLVVPLTLDMFSGNAYAAMPSEISFNPFIYVGTILFALATVSLSCRKPAKLAGKISPVEALKYNGLNQRSIKPKTTTDGGKLFKMAFRNVFQEKKRAILVFASLMMGSLALLATRAFIGSMTLENYIDRYLPYDYILYMDSSTEEGEPDPRKAAAAEQLAKDVENIDGVTSVMVNRTVYPKLLFDSELFAPFLENEKERPDDTSLDEIIAYYNEDKENNYSAPVLSVDRKMLERHNEKADQKIDIEAFQRGEICFMGYVETMEQALRMKDKTITLINPENGKRRDIKVGVCATYTDHQGIEAGTYWRSAASPTYLLVSPGVLDELAGTVPVSQIIADCKPEAEGSVTKQIKALAENNTSIPSVSHIEIKSNMIADFKTSTASMNILTAGISIVLILIGIINFINVMLTGIFSRRRELAVMESIGMTKRQIQKMLMLEGVYYGAITTGLILTVGSGVIYLVAKLAAQAADYAIFYYPWKLLLLVVVILLLVCILVPAIVYGMLTKESVTERLRTVE